MISKAFIGAAMVVVVCALAYYAGGAGSIATAGYSFAPPRKAMQTSEL